MAENTTPEDNKPVEKPALSDTELRAQSQGWVPKEEWDGDPDSWRPAKEFLDRGELFKKIDEQNRVIKDFRKTIEDLSKHNAEIAKVEYKRALDTLRAEKKTALENLDAEAVLRIDDQIDVVREAQRKAETTQVHLPQAPAELNPIFVAWKDRNGWYETNKAMRAYADKIGNELHGMSPTELLATVEKEVKKEFADRFKNPNRDKPGAVEGSGPSKSGKAKDDLVLSDDERRIMERFVRTIPGFTKEKYMEQLKAKRNS